MKVRCLGFECANMIEDTVSHGTCQHCVNEEDAMMHALDICSKHQQALGEGDICDQCEADYYALRETGSAVHFHTNNLLVKHYLHIPEGAARTAVFGNHKHLKLRAIAHATWAVGRDQALIECVIHGYALCVAFKIVDEVHTALDIGYAKWYATLEDKQDHPKYPVQNLLS